ncbi:hypothetical protein GOB91_29135 [Sinorhizobium meliloti]|nr:hypothetical protein [Sinorhizobium meliloti]MDW9732620.1 hypothetical protein [Sinorhizobium meliloti]
MIEDVRRLVALACEYGAMIDIVFEGSGDVRVSVYPSDKPDMVHSDGKGNVHLGKAKASQ